MGRQELDELSIGEAAGLGQSVHAAANFDEKVAVVYQRQQVVLLNDCSGHHEQGNTHIFVPSHGCAQVKVFEVGCQEFGIGCGENAVEHKLCGCQISRFRADVKGIINFVATDGPADTAGVGFFGAVRGDNAQICGLAVFRNGGERNEEHGVGAFDGAVALREASDFVGI